jgi:hypothetical protein
MKESKTPTEFLDSVKNKEPCFMTIGFSDLYSTLEALEGISLGGERFPNNWGSLRSVCPVCSSWVRPYALGMVAMLRTKEEREKVTFTNYGDISHLLDNHCTNPKCSSQLIQLIWQGDQGIKEQLTKQLQLIQTDPENQGHDSLLRVVSGMQDYDVLSFAQDMIFSAELNHPNRLTGGGLSPAANPGKIAIWVSVIPFLPFSENVMTIAFPSGYKSYFNRLVAASRYDEGDIAVAHWISLDSGLNRMVGLALLCDKNSIGTPRAFRILPAGIL